jgi:hypothetical protein
MARQSTQKQAKTTTGTSGTDKTDEVNRNAGASGSSAAGGASGSAIEMLKQDHRKVEGLFEKFAQSEDDDEKEGLVEQICQELILHMRLEEDIFYPACRRAGVEADAMDEAQVEHDSAKMLVNDLLRSHSGTPFWEAKVSVLKEMIKHHVEEEEKPKDGPFAQAKEHGIDETAIGAQLKERKEELQEREAGSRPIRPIAIGQAQSMTLGGPEHGRRERFMGEDDGRDDRRPRPRPDDDIYHYDHAPRTSRAGRYEDDERYGDSARYGRGGGYREDNDHDRRSSRDRDERGRFMSDDVHREGSRGGSGRGWSGDARGHSDAARRGWDERRSGAQDDARRGSRDDERHYYYTERVRRGDDDDDRRRSDDHGGWFGDSRGHAEAARRGWQHRR